LTHHLGIGLRAFGSAVLLSFGTVSAVGCGQSHTALPASLQAVDKSVVRFRYELVAQNGSLDAESLRGRATIITFVTTFDLASQAQVRFVTGVMKRHVPRINAAAVVLEPHTNAPLVTAFVDALRLPYPVAWGDDETFAGRGPFGDVHAVPTTIVLDKSGRVAWKRVGLAQEDELGAALDRL
jgi:hypothetical protein